MSTESVGIAQPHSMVAGHYISQFKNRFVIMLFLFVSMGSPKQTVASSSGEDISSQPTNCPKRYATLDEALQEPLLKRPIAVCLHFKYKTIRNLGKAADECASVIRTWKQVSRVEVEKGRDPVTVVVYFDTKKLTPSDAPDISPDRIEYLFALPMDIPLYPGIEMPVGCHF